MLSLTWRATTAQQTAAGSTAALGVPREPSHSPASIHEHVLALATCLHIGSHSATVDMWIRRVLSALCSGEGVDIAASAGVAGQNQWVTGTWPCCARCHEI